MDGLFFVKWILGIVRINASNRNTITTSTNSELQKMFKKTETPDFKVFKGTIVSIVRTVNVA